MEESSIAVHGIESLSTPLVFLDHHNKPTAVVVGSLRSCKIRQGMRPYLLIPLVSAHKSALNAGLLTVLDWA